ncbi:hypothetical protein [Magnetospirillum fulvum]|uniref:hypothetical protein n=1 Tax=Magnetospirillum fulvum TaxID=1082 RepID=UPI0012DECDD7|nr:hypothetical protein [Magnetospirillum fulvum]
MVDGIKYKDVDLKYKFKNLTSVINHDKFKNSEITIQPYHSGFTCVYNSSEIRNASARIGSIFSKTWTPIRIDQSGIGSVIGSIAKQQSHWSESSGAICGALAETVRTVRNVESQIGAIISNSLGIVGSIRSSLSSPELSDWVIRWGCKDRAIGALKKAGWLPHPAIPSEFVLEVLDNGGEDALSHEVERYLCDNWVDISKNFMVRFERSGADQETLDAMNEALACRANGLHRAVCRTVFPEIERAVRMRMPPPNPERMTSLTEIREIIAKLPIGAFDISPIDWMPVFEHIQDACYTNVGGDASVSDFPFPNRHAVAHGRLPCSTPRDSMNSLVIADFMFSCLGSAVIHLTREGASAEEEVIAPHGSPDM